MGCNEMYKEIKLYTASYLYLHIWALLLLSFSGSVRSGHGGHMRGHRTAFTDHILAFNYKQRVIWKQQTEVHLVQKREKRERTSWEVKSLNPSSHSWTCYTRADSQSPISLSSVLIYICVKNHPLRSTKSPYIKYGLSWQSPAVR